MPEEPANGAARPTHLVVFKSLTEGVLERFARDHNVDPRPAEKRPSGVEMFGPATRDGMTLAVYREFGIIGLEASATLVRQMQSDDRIAAVCVNERRQLPEVYESGPDVGPTPDAGGPAMLALAPTKPLSPSLQQMAVDATQATGAGVSVAVLDTGIDLTHPDFQTRFLPNTASMAATFVAGETVQDGHGHGTHCAGIIAGPAATGGNLRFGVAPNVDLLVAKVMDNNGGGWDDNILEGLLWAALNGAEIVSMSFGTARQVNQPYNEAYEQAAKFLRASFDILLIAAAGNFSDRPNNQTAPVMEPAAAPSILAVAAVDVQNQIWPYCCRQMDPYSKISVSAPGTAVYSSWPLPASYYWQTGTSMAAAHAAAIAALHAEANNHPSADQLQTALEANVIKLGDPADFGAGLVQAP
jgi:subtilisin